MWESARSACRCAAVRSIWIEGGSGIVEIGAAADVARLRVRLRRAAPSGCSMARACARRHGSVNGEWAAVHRRRRLWPTATSGCPTAGPGCRPNAIEAPLYWRRDGGAWLDALRARRSPVDPAAPVTPCQLLRSRCLCPLGRRAPADRVRVGSRGRRARSASGQPARRGRPGRSPRAAPGGSGLPQMFGDVWEWTGSAYLAYPGFRPGGGRGRRI